LATRARLTIQTLEKRRVASEAQSAASQPFRRQRYALECIGPFPAAVAYVSLLEQLRWPLALQRVEISEAKERDGTVALAAELDALIPDASFPMAAPALADPGVSTPTAIRDLFPAKAAAQPEAAPAAKAVDFGDVVVTGIIGSGDLRSALVNGSVVRAGSSVNGADVIAIGEDRIVIQKQGERREVFLCQEPEREARRPAKTKDGARE